MSYEHKDGFGNFFKNSRKENDKQPDYKGEIMLGGVLYEIAGWKKEGAKGPYLSLKGSIPRAKETAAPTRTAPRRNENDSAW